MAAMMAAMMAAPQQQTCATREFNYCAGVNARFSCRYNLANSNEDGPGLHHFLDKIELLSASDFVWWWMLLQRGGINTCFQLLVQACLAGSRQECNLSGQNRGKGQRPRQHRADPRKATAKLLVRGRLRWLTEAEMDEVSTQRRPKGILKEQHQRPTSRRPVRPKQPHQDPLRKWSQSGPKQSLEQLVCGRTVIRPQSIPTTRCTLSLKFELNSCLLGCG
ncbi:uncharacterized protein LOC121895364 isoform X1 [Thunnus maccoyii]|uniref:uncharacterized protein LOC121895364 isoform X1 n=1 Tax=Thunnus maccoyii TaxID=8240 RepID=UPI001C4C062A|nr:uncharacterized protein LOC121895364 isoform X1 [Thunnus maccoyii]